MEFKTLIFYLFSSILVAAGIRVITARNPVHAALHLVLAFFNAAAIWMLLEAEFLAIALILVYVGAVMVLFLFVVMMLDLDLDHLRKSFWQNLPLGLAVSGVIVVEMLLVITQAYQGVALNGHSNAATSNTKALGNVLYTQYLYPFEIAAIILLVAMIAAIALTLRKRKESKYQNPGQQIRIRRQDRVELIAMPAEIANEAAGKAETHHA